MDTPGLGTFTTLLDQTLTLIPRTWKTSLFWASVLSLAPFLMNALSYGAAARSPGSVLPAVLGLAALVLQALAAIFVRACVTAQTLKAARGEPSSAGDASAAAGRLILPLVGQRILVGLIFLGVCMAAAVVIGAGAAAGVVLNTDSLTVPAILAGTAGAAAALLFFWIRYTFAVPSIVEAGTPAPQSFGVSASLVRGSWWKLLGWRLLFAVMTGFGTGLIITPVAFFTLAPAFLRLPVDFVPQDLSALQRLASELRQSLWPGVGIVQYAASVLSALIGPVFTTLLYLEMKRRNALVPPTVVTVEALPSGGGAPEDRGTAQETPHEA